MKKVIMTTVCSCLVLSLVSCAPSANIDTSTEAESSISDETIIVEPPSPPEPEDLPPTNNILNDSCFIYKSDEFELSDYIEVVDDIDNNLIGKAEYSITPDFSERRAGKYTVKVSVMDSSSNITKEQFDLRAISDIFKKYDGYWKTDSDDGFKMICIKGGIWCTELYFLSDTFVSTLCEGDGYIYRKVSGANLIGDKYTLKGDTIVCDDYRYDSLEADAKPVEHHIYTYYRCTEEEFNQAVNEAKQRHEENEELNRQVREYQQQSENNNAKHTTSISAGTYLVGTDIDAGTYKLTATSSYGGYWERAKNATGEFDSILANENFENTAYVTVINGDFLKLVRCTGTLTK